MASGRAFVKIRHGRNFLGTPPQGRADYTFLQHIIMSLNNKTGRCAILFPHGVLFRNEETEMRKKLVELDVVECVLGLGKNLFYNSPMEACIMICRMNKPANRKNKVLFINAVHEVTRERAQSFLDLEHIQKIAGAYYAFETIDGFSFIARLIRFPDWQYTTAGERLVRKELRKILYVKYKIQDQELFDKAYGYIKTYY